MGKLKLPYFYGHEAEQYAFYRIPKTLISDPRFRNISIDAKLLYGLMLDRMSLSMPSLGMLTINALTAADSVIIPVQAQYLPAKGLEQLLRTITRVKRQLNPKLEVDGIVLTMVDSRTTLAREINALVRKTYGGHVFASEIPRSIKAAEISVENKSIYDHDRSGKAALAYENLTREVLSIGKQIKRHRTDPVR